MTATTRRVRVGVLAIALAMSVMALAVVIRSGSSPSTFDASSAPEPAQATAEPPTVTVSDSIATGLTSPWGLAFLPDGSALVSERDTGLIKRIPASGGEPVVLGPVEGSVPSGEGGLLGLAVPLGPEPSFVLAYTTTATDNRIVRIEWDGERLGDQAAILTGIPKNTYHDGGRLLAAPDGTFVVGTGDAGSPTWRRILRAWPARSCASQRTAPRHPAIRTRPQRSTPSGTAMFRASPSTVRGGCGRASSDRTMPTS